MRRVLPLVLAGLASCAISVVGTEPAAACSCAPFSDDRSFAAADAVFAGTIAGVELQGPPLEPGRGAAVWAFAVDRVFKGLSAPTIRVASEPNGSMCGLELRQPNGALVEPEGSPLPVLVFATELPSPARLPHDDIRLVASLCNGTRTLAEGPIPASFGAGEPPALDGAGLPRVNETLAAAPLPAPTPLPAPLPAPAAATGGGPAWWLLAGVGAVAAAGGGVGGAAFARRRLRGDG